MSKGTSGKPAKVARKAAAGQVAAKAARPRKTAPKSLAKSSARKVEKPALLAGGNPQIAKADGDAPVQAYIAAMPGWKRDVGRRLDALIVRTVPGVRKAVKWNSPLYGVEGPEGGNGWFLSFHCFTKYVKVAFFRGASLRPVPPGESKSKDMRYLDIHEDDQLDEAQLAAWVKQASQLPRRTDVSGKVRGACGVARADAENSATASRRRIDRRLRPSMADGESPEVAPGPLPFGKRDPLALRPAGPISSPSRDDCVVYQF